MNAGQVERPGGGAAGHEGARPLARDDQAAFLEFEVGVAGGYQAHLLALGQLYLDGGRHAGKQIVPADWVKTSIAAHARVDDGVEYGYLWWRMQFPVAGKVWSSYAMNGSGGNSVQVFPEQRAVVVITTTNYDVQQPHRITAKLLMEKILPGL